MIHIDSKITIWDRFTIDDKHEPELMEFLSGNPGTSAQDIIVWAENQGIAGEHSTLIETGEELSPADNGGAATLEVMRQDGEGLKTIFTNVADD